jgi:hypothetical protein
MTHLSHSAPERRARLLAVKLSALVRDHDGGEVQIPGTFALGAALLAGDRAWILLDDIVDDGRGLGAALVWATRQNVAELNLVADEPLTVAARRAGAFRLPIRVWSVSERALQQVDRAPVRAPRAPRPEHTRLLPDIEAAGATPVIEHGVVTGEVRGLEVCRVVDVDGPDGPAVRLEVGVGAHDRDAFTIIHGDIPTPQALAGVVAKVAAVRDHSAPGHPLNRLAPERFVRWRLEQEPWLVGMASVEPAQPPVQRGNLKDRVACTAHGHRPDGASVVLVFSVGVDLDVIPYAADARLAAGSEPGALPETMIVLPARDVVPATKELAGLLRHSVALVTLESTA